MLKRLTTELPESMKVVCLTEVQIEQMVSLLNAILDLEDFSENEEQVVFRHATCQASTSIIRADRQS